MTGCLGFRRNRGDWLYTGLVPAWLQMGCAVLEDELRTENCRVLCVDSGRVACTVRVHWCAPGTAEPRIRTRFVRTWVANSVQYSTDVKVEVCINYVQRTKLWSKTEVGSLWAKSLQAYQPGRPIDGYLSATYRVLRSNRLRKMPH